MKQLVKTIFATVALSAVLMSNVALAEQKIAVVNAESVFQSMPQFISTQQSLSIEFKDRFAEMEAMRANLAEQVNKFRKDQPTMSESQIKAEEARLTELNKQFETKAAPLQKEYQERMKAEEEKIGQVLMQAIQAVAAEEKYDLVLNRKAAVFVNPAHDISDKVLKKVSQIK